jgi:hypothetical protein
VKPVQLRAVDAADLTILSALLQDAIIPIADLGFLPEQNLFVLMVNRYVWEDGRDGSAPAAPGTAGSRIHCAVRIHQVRTVRKRGLDIRRRDQFLSLLSLELADDGAALILHLSGDADIRLEIDALDIRVEDQGEPWPAATRPDHGA